MDEGEGVLAGDEIPLTGEIPSRLMRIGEGDPGATTEGEPDVCPVI